MSQLTAPENLKDMKKAVLMGAMLLAVVAVDARAQAETSSATRKRATGSTLSTAPMNGPESMKSSRTNQRKSGSGSTVTTTDSATAGSVTNDGASGQSGSPVDDPSAETNHFQTTKRAMSTQKIKRSKSKQNNQSTATSSKSSRQ